MTITTDRAIAGALGLTVAAMTLLASTRQGITRDEAYYMRAGEQYVAYFEDAVSGRLPNPISAASIERYWSYNTEHPSLMKLLYGISWRIFHRCTCAVDSARHPDVSRIVAGQHVSLGLLSEVTAFRLPAAACFGTLCVLVYWFSREAFGSRRGACAAALLMFAQPRAFFHAQTANFDLPVATLWFATTYAYWRALEAKTWRAASVVGIVFGLALATKLQAGLLAIALSSHWGWLARQRRRYGRPAPDPKGLIAMLGGPLVMVVTWPWVWHDPIRRLFDYVEFHLHHVHYNFEYLGRNYNRPPYPWHEPLGMLILTAPVTLLVLAVAGIVLLIRRGSPPTDTRSTRALLLVSGALPVMIFMPGVLPIYGETKHWLATMPVLAMAAGYGLERLGAALERELDWASDGSRCAALSLALVIIAVAPAIAETVRSHPYGLSYYNALAGGAPGGADLGMNRQFWGYAVRGVLPWLNANLPRNAVVFFHDTNHDSYNVYVRDRQLRPDLIYAQDVGEAGTRFVSDAALVIHEKHFNDVEYRIWETYSSVQPAEVLTFDGVPLVTIYVRP